MERVREAIEDFEKAVQLNPNFAIAYVQKCYTEYRWAYATGNVEKSKAIMQTFQEAIRRFPMCSECYTLFAQVLTDQQDYELADQYYDKGYKVDPENGTILVHRGTIVFLKFILFIQFIFLRYYVFQHFYNSNGMVMSSKLSI